MTQRVTLQCGDASLTLLPELGGRIANCTLVDAAGVFRPVLHPYPQAHTDLEHWGKGGLYPLIPYSGRLRDAKIACGGKVWPLAPYQGSPHTLHGIAHRRPWTVIQQEAASATLCYRHAPDEHWPWPFEARLEVTLKAHELALTLELINTGRERMPGGLGFHPYVPLEAGHDIRFRASAPCAFDRDYLMQASTCRPTHAIAQRIDLDSAGAGEVTRMHALWAGVLRSGSQDRALHVQAQGALKHLIVHRPSAAPYVCIEPVSHLPDAFNLPAADADWMGAVTLDPGQSLSGHLRLMAGRVDL